MRAGDLDDVLEGVRFTAEGKLGEAGQKLEQHKHTLDEIKRLAKP